VAITTTSAFGRSSIYNRLKYRDRLAAIPIGMTSGYGNFHLNGLVQEVRQWLKRTGHEIKTGYGTGPRAIWTDIALACNKLGINPHDVLQHGIEREAYLFPLVRNLHAVMQEGAAPVYHDAPFAEVAAWWQERWLIRRAQTDQRYREWRREQTLAAIAGEISPATPLVV
jgi:hypothetical protein